MPTERDLVVRQSAFLMDCPESADAVHEERVVLDGSLESLQAVPFEAFRERKEEEGYERGMGKCGTYRSCCVRACAVIMKSIQGARSVGGKKGRVETRISTNPKPKLQASKPTSV
jgi:hypothetical protein